MNRITLLGNLGADPLVRFNGDGQRFATFRLATSEKWTDRQSGEKRERTEWHSVTIFNTAIVPVVEQYLKKGSRVLIEGMLRYHAYKDAQDVERLSADIILGNRATLQMLDRAPATAKAAAEPASEEAPPPAAQQQTQAADDFTPPF